MSVNENNEMNRVITLTDNFKSSLIVLIAGLTLSTLVIYFEFFQSYLLKLL